MAIKIPTIYRHKNCVVHFTTDYRQALTEKHKKYYNFYNTKNNWIINQKYKEIV